MHEEGLQSRRRWTKLVKDLILQAHLTAFYLCGYGNNSLELQVQSQLPLNNFH
jgi:hypothetical protein